MGKGQTTKESALRLTRPHWQRERTESDLKGGKGRRREDTILEKDKLTENPQGRTRSQPAICGSARPDKQKRAAGEKLPNAPQHFLH